MKSLLPDEQLISLYLITRQGGYFDQLYQRHAAVVYRTCLRFTKSDDEARDLVQDVFLRVLSNLHRFRGESKFSTWLYAVTYNCCVEQTRRVKNRLLTAPLTDYVVDTLGDSSEPDQEHDRADRLALVLQSLPAAEATVLRLKYEQGLAVRHIAEQLNVSESALKMRLKRSRDRIRDAYYQR